jgi:non-ribosomal peptide synthetase component F
VIKSLMVLSPDRRELDALDLARRLLRGSGVTIRPSDCVLVTGTDQVLLAGVVALLYDLGASVVILPQGVDRGAVADPYVRSTHELYCHDGRVDVTCGARSGSPLPAGTLVYFTSGSTGRPRPIAVTHDQLELTAAEYARIYRFEHGHRVATTLPVSYNFTVVAGVLLAAESGGRLELPSSPRQLAELATSGGGRRVVVCNPVLVEELSAAGQRTPDTLYDSGGAPLSTTAIMRFREHIGDIREGYGLTETCSLTHFDSEGSADSLGTVGRAMRYCRTQVVDVEGKPRLKLSSSNAGRDLSRSPLLSSEWLDTMDAGHEDLNGRLRVLGRADDYPIGGLWPRDTVDVIGPVLGWRCALVRQPSPSQVRITVLHPCTEAEADALRRVVLARMDREISVKVADASGSILHSGKIARN